MEHKGPASSPGDVVPAVVRIAFGLIWAVDATCKWAPGFSRHIGSYLSADGQPGWVGAWISWWAHVVGHAPGTVAVVLAVSETLLALSLLLGLYVRVACVAGAFLSLLIWSTAEAFGGPYLPGSTDVGASIVYVLVFALLFWADAGRHFGLDGVVARRGVGPVSRRTWLGVAAVAGVAVLAVGLTARATTGPLPDGVGPTAGGMSGCGGQMAMDPGGQAQHADC